VLRKEWVSLIRAPGADCGAERAKRRREPWESGELQRILYGGRWWLPLSPSRGELSESKVARG